MERGCLEALTPALSRKPASRLEKCKQGRLVLVRRPTRSVLTAGTFLPLLLALVLYDFIVLSNLLEQSGLTDMFDPLEDVAEIVFAFSLLLFVNNWRKDRSEARFRDLFKLAPLPLAEVDLDGKLREVNDLLPRILQNTIQQD